MKTSMAIATKSRSKPAVTIASTAIRKMPLAATKTKSFATGPKTARAALRAAISAKAAPEIAPKAALKAPVKAASGPQTAKSVKPKKPKLVRDSFTIPKVEYTVLDDLKQRAVRLASPAKKSELLRAGIKALAALSDAAYVAALGAVPTIKTGRPKKV